MATYQQLYDSAVNWMTSNCINVANFADMSAALKSGYTNTITKTGSITGNQNYVRTAKVVLTISNPISSVAASTVQTNFKQALTDYGITLGNTVTGRGIIAFMNALSAFSAAHIRITASQFCSTKYVVYIAQTYTTSYKLVTSPYDLTSNLKIATDIATLTANMPTIIAATSKVYPVRYTADFSSS